MTQYVGPVEGEFNERPYPEVEIQVDTDGQGRLILTIVDFADSGARAVAYLDYNGADEVRSAIMRELRDWQK